MVKYVLNTYGRYLVHLLAELFLWWMTHKPMLKHVLLSLISPIKAILSSCASYTYMSVRKYPCRKSRRFGGAEQWNQGSSSMLDAAWEETLASSNARSPWVTGSGIRATTPSMACMADDYDVRMYIRAVVGSILSSASYMPVLNCNLLILLLNPAKYSSQNKKK